MSDNGDSDDYFDWLSSSKQTDTRYVFRFELNRLRSFVTWPPDAKAYPTCLARVGLYYLGTSDTVACFVCNVHLGQWDEEDLPLGEHERHSPNCGFVLGQDVGNVPLLTGSQIFTIEVIREQEDEIRSQRAIAQSTGLGKTSDDGTTNDIAESLQNLNKKYPFSVLVFQQSPVSSFLRGKTQVALGSRQHDSMLEVQAGRGNTASDSSSLQADPVSQKLQELRLTSSDGSSRSSPLVSERQQQIQQAIISVATEPVRQGITEYCPVDVLQSIMQSSNHPQYAHINRRIESYATWPYSHIQSPIKLAEAGFYYTGREDRIRCFLCNGGLCNWETEDIPWYEHCKWFERCRYALACKKHPVVLAIVNTATQLRSSDTHSSLQGETQCDDLQRAASLSTPEASPSTPEPTIQRSLRSQLLDMGFAEDRVNRIQEMTGTSMSLEEALEFLTSGELPASPPNVPSADAASSQQGAAQVVSTSSTDVAAAASANMDLDAESMASDPKARDESNKKRKKKNKKRNGKRDTSSTREEDGACAAEPTRDALEVETNIGGNTGEDISSLLKENETLKSRRTCKVCMERDVSIIFLPCSHLVCCLECAMQVTTCPFCRGPIKATVKVYI